MGFFNYIFVIVCVASFATLQTVAENTCDIQLDNCDYEISVSPTGHCRGNNVKGQRLSRSRRAPCDDSTSNMSNVLAGVTAKVEKLQHRMTKEMQQLSTRVLRGVRRMDNSISDLMAKYTKHGMRDPYVCPPGFVSMDNWRSCYMFSKFNATWYEARDYCGALDSELLSLTTLKEHYLVSFFIKNNDDIRNAEAWWTSGQFVSKTKTWMWTSETEMRPFSFIKWAVGEPNDSSLQCVMLFSGDNHFWHDQLCTEKFNFVCEFETRLNE